MSVFYFQVLYQMSPKVSCLILLKRQINSIFTVCSVSFTINALKPCNLQTRKMTTQTATTDGDKKKRTVKQLLQLLSFGVKQHFQTKICKKQVLGLTADNQSHLSFPALSQGKPLLELTDGSAGRVMVYACYPSTYWLMSWCCKVLTQHPLTCVCVWRGCECECIACDSCVIWPDLWLCVRFAHLPLLICRGEWRRWSTVSSLSGERDLPLPWEGLEWSDVSECISEMSAKIKKKKKIIYRQLWPKTNKNNKEFINFLLLQCLYCFLFCKTPFSWI